MQNIQENDGSMYQSQSVFCVGVYDMNRFWETIMFLLHLTKNRFGQSLTVLNFQSLSFC